MPSPYTPTSSIIRWRLLITRTVSYCCWLKCRISRAVQAALLFLFNFLNVLNQSQELIFLRQLERRLLKHEAFNPIERSLISFVGDTETKWLTNNSITGFVFETSPIQQQSSYDGFRFIASYNSIVCLWGSPLVWRVTFQGIHSGEAAACKRKEGFLFIWCHFLYPTIASYHQSSSNRKMPVFL